MLNVPNETLIDIVQYLSLPDLLSLCESNSQFRDLCKDQRVWTYLLNRDYNLESPCPELAYRYSYLKNNYNELVGQYDRLVGQHNQLVGKYNESKNTSDYLFLILPRVRDNYGRDINPLFTFQGKDVQDLFKYLFNNIDTIPGPLGTNLREYRDIYERNRKNGYYAMDRPFSLLDLELFFIESPGKHYYQILPIKL